MRQTAIKRMILGSLLLLLPAVATAQIQHIQGPPVNSQSNQPQKQKPQKANKPTAQKPSKPKEPELYFTGKTVEEIVQMGDDYFFERNGKDRDDVLATKCYRKAAELGYPTAQFNLARSYEQGFGVKKDAAECVKWYLKAAEQGYTPAFGLLGYHYQYGFGVDKDRTEAAKWYRKAAENGDKGCAGTLKYYFNEEVQVPDYEAEFEGKTASEMADIAEDYYYGRNGKYQDYGKASKWAQKSAELGNAKGQYIRGYYFEFGIQRLPNRTLAADAYQLAADQGYAKAQYRLGNLYFNGDGVTQDKEKAKELWRKSAAQGNQDSKDNLKKYFNE